MAIGYAERTVFQQGALVGAIAFVAGLVLMLPLVLAGGGSAAGLGQSPVATLVVSYVLIHVWPVFFGFPLRILLLSALPIGLLVGAGYAAAWRTAEIEYPAHYRGAAVVVGYLALTGVGYGYTVVRLGMEASGDPGQVAAEGSLPIVFAAVGYTGLLLPVVFGGLGGYLYDWRSGGSES